MELVLPGLGLIFWQTIIFLIVLFVLTRFAWKPISTALKDREESIADALAQAELAKEEMKKLQANNEKLLDEARVERDKILKAAHKAAEETREDAKSKASTEVSKMLEDARKAIETEKQAALSAIKAQIATMSIEIAEALLKKELENPEKQKQLVADLIKDLKVN
jgi:F-type H+-transporting ATPase subunit b